MTAHEMILLCSSLQGVRTCILLCLVLGFATFAAFGKLHYPPALGLKQHSKFFLGPLVLARVAQCGGVRRRPP